MATQLSIWREASRLLGSQRLAGLTDNSDERYAFEDSYDRVVEYVLRQAYWRFALKTLTQDESVTVEPLEGYSVVYDLPCDWLRTHAIFISGNTPALEGPIDVKHQLEQLHTNVAPIFLRYISSDFADPDTWPEQFAYAVAARLAFDCAERITGNPAKIEQMQAKWQEAMQLAIVVDAIPDDQWLRHQLNGTYLTGLRWLLKEAVWKFSIKSTNLTGTTSNVSPGYRYAALKPDDYGRVVHYYYNMGNRWSDIDFRDEDGRLHSQWQATTLRYVSTEAEDSTMWSDGFRRALVAYLEFEEAKRNPQTPGAVLQARGIAWSDAFRNARLKDDMMERPRYNNVGRLVQSRRGYGNSSYGREQGWGW